jgi:hypothetical protein
MWGAFGISGPYSVDGFENHHSKFGGEVHI